MYLPCYPLVLRNKYTDEITYIYTSDLRGNIINLQMDMEVFSELYAGCDPSLRLIDRYNVFGFFVQNQSHKNDIYLSKIHFLILNHSHQNWKKYSRFSTLYEHQ